MNILSGPELLKALSDLPIALLCIPAICILAAVDTEKKKEKKMWMLIFAGIMIAAILGTAAHGIAMAEWSLRILWVFLYFFMFLITFLFSNLVREICIGGRGSRKEQTIYFTVTVLFFALAAGKRALTGKNMIGVYVFYGIISAVMMILCFWKRKKTKCSNMLLFAFFLLLAGLLFQGIGMLVSYFQGASFAHLTIFFAVAVLIHASKLHIGETNR